MTRDHLTPDSEMPAAALRLPARLRPFVLLARLDRPVGWWLLYWPCAAGLLLAGGIWTHATLLLWMLLGAIAMRGAGCVYNDIADRDLDARVERTRSRPLPSGMVGLKAAWAWLLLLCLAGLLVLVQLRPEAQAVALASLALVAAYPFMKRITGFPQAWLGIVFSWGVPVAWVAVRGWDDPLAPMFWLHLGCALWVVGYDTIYALQDLEDDALAGIGSSARTLGRHVRVGVALAYAGALGGWTMAIWTVRPDPLALLALLPVAVHLGWQFACLDRDDGTRALALFRSNRRAGMLLALACAAVGSAG